MNDRERSNLERPDKVGEIFFLLRRHLRAIVGVVVFCSIVGWIFYASSTPRKPKSVGAWGKILPTANIDSQPKVSENANASEEDDRKVAKLKLVNFLAEGTIDEFIEDMLALRDAWAKNELPVAFLLVQRRAKIARRLIEMDISDDQLIFAYNEYIESVITLDGLNARGQMQVPGIRKALIEVGEKFGSHPDPVISSKASLSYVLAKSNDYLNSKDSNDLNGLAAQFDLHGDRIMKNRATTTRLIKMIDNSYRASNFLPDFQECAKKVLAKLEASSDEPMIQLARELRESIYFSKFDLVSLADRIEGGNNEARNDVQGFFEALAENPNSRAEIYQIAIDVIAEFKRLGAHEDAASLANWLGQINLENPDEETKERVVTAVATLKQ